MPSLKARIAKLEGLAAPTMEKFILDIGMPTFKAMLDYVQSFIAAVRAEEVDTTFTPPAAIKDHFLRWGQITRPRAFRTVLNKAKDR